MLETLAHMLALFGLKEGERFTKNGKHYVVYANPANAMFANLFLVHATWEEDFQTKDSVKTVEFHQLILLKTNPVKLADINTELNQYYRGTASVFNTEKETKEQFRKYKESILQIVYPKGIMLPVPESVGIVVRYMEDSLNHGTYDIFSKGKRIVIEGEKLKKIQS